MKKLFEFITYLFYRYYNKGSTKVIAYESALIAVSALIFLNVFAILMFLKIDTSWISKIEQDYGKTIKLISGLFLILPQYFILKFTLRKEEVIKKKIDLQRAKKLNIFLILYIVFSVLLLIFSIKIK
jgi:succinate-acetate transporter protein